MTQMKAKMIMSDQTNDRRGIMVASSKPTSANSRAGENKLNGGDSENQAATRQYEIGLDNVKPNAMKPFSRVEMAYQSGDGDVKAQMVISNNGVANNERQRKQELKAKKAKPKQQPD